MFGIYSALLEIKNIIIRQIYLNKINFYILFKELPLELRSLLGAIPVDYLSYFTTRFPMVF